MDNDLSDLIYKITPSESPLSKLVTKHNKRMLGRFGKSIRSIKRRIARPTKFSTSYKNSKYYGWGDDTLSPTTGIHYIK